MDNEKWFTVGPAWGDSFLCYLKAVQHEDFPINPNVIFYTSFLGIKDFFLSDNKIKKHKVVPWDSFLKNIEFNNWFYTKKPSEESIFELSKLAEVNPDQIILNHVINARPPTPFPQPIKTHKKSNLLNYIKNDFILIQPYSFNSCGIRQHYRDWHSVIQFASSLPFQSVIVGSSYIKNYNNSINLSACLIDMQDVFALADRAKLVITTSNGLAYYCVCNNIPSLILCNDNCSEKNGSLIWRSFLKLGSNSILINSTDNISRVKDATFSIFAKNENYLH